MRSALLVLAASLGACVDLPEPTHYGEHVVVAADPGHSLCGGTLAHMDAFVAALSAEFSLAPPVGDDRFTVYLLEAEHFHARAPCAGDAGGCAFAGSAYIQYAPHDHELVHNVAEAFGYPRPLFIEGLAVAFGGLGADIVPEPDDRAPPEHLDIRDLLGLTTSLQLRRLYGYATAGAFTTHLIRNHGLAAYLRMYEAVDPFETPRGIDRVFREEFGVSLDDSIAAFEAAEPCPVLESDAKLLECAAPELEWSGQRLTYHRALACEQGDVVGPYDSDSAVVFHTVTIPADGHYELTVLGDDPRNRVSLQPCTICDGDGLTVAADQPQRIAALAAGRYSLRLHGPASVRTGVGVRIEPVDAPVHLP